jgi:5-methylcytosine-specific restriction endonuclease McrA
MICPHGISAIRDCKECARIRARKWGADNRERNKKNCLTWYAANRESQMAKFRASYDPARNSEACREWREQNKEYKAAYDKQYAQENPDKRRLIAINYKHRRRAWIGDDRIAISDLEALLVKQGMKCAAAECGRDISEERHLDHIQPLSKRGRHIISNVQWLCPDCNFAKRDRMPKEA